MLEFCIVAGADTAGGAAITIVSESGDDAVAVLFSFSIALTLFRMSSAVILNVPHVDFILLTSLLYHL